MIATAALALLVAIGRNRTFTESLYLFILLAAWVAIMMPIVATWVRVLATIIAYFLKPMRKNSAR
jgi:hypothetical protein